MWAKAKAAIDNNNNNNNNNDSRLELHLACPVTCRAMRSPDRTKSGPACIAKSLGISRSSAAHSSAAIPRPLVRADPQDRSQLSLNIRTGLSNSDRSIEMGDLSSAVVECSISTCRRSTSS